jgi:small multidrug resistance pump
MKLSDGFSRLVPSVAVAVIFVPGAAMLARAVQADQLATTYLVGLGVEAILSAGLGLLLFGERLTTGSACGLLLIGAGVAAVRFG